MNKKEKEEYENIIRALAIVIIKDIVAKSFPSQSQEDSEYRQEILDEIFFGKPEKEKSVNNDNWQMVGERYLKAMRMLDYWVCTLKNDNYDESIHEKFQELYAAVLVPLYEMGQLNYPAYYNENGEFRLKFPGDFDNKE